jgi:hypothetical protein
MRQPGPGYAACGRLDLVRACFDADGRLRPDAASSRSTSGRIGLHWAIPSGHLEVVRLLLERGADPSIRDELFQAGADGRLHLLYATRWHDPVTQQLHDLIESRSR